MIYIPLSQNDINDEKTDIPDPDGLIVFSACKNKENAPNTAETKETSILEKIAYAHGYGNWGRIEKIAFTFNVDRDSSHFERRWEWLPKTNSVTYSTRQDTISYNRKKLDSTLDKTNAGFVNDKYWLLAPFQLIWDKNNFTYNTTMDVAAPISGTPMRKLTIVYGKDGGYTPGDAYDFYLGEDYRIQEWAFRKGNQEEPIWSPLGKITWKKRGLSWPACTKGPIPTFNSIFQTFALRQANEKRAS